MGYDSVKAEMGTYGSHTAAFLTKITGGLISSPKGRMPINSTLQRIMSTIVSAANFMVLGLSAVTSLADPIGIGIRTGEFREVVKSVKDIFNKQTKQELEVLAETLGAIGDEVNQEALSHEYSSAYMSKSLKKANEWFFKAIQLERVTKASRIMAVGAGRRFLLKHSKSPGQHSVRYLKELGLKRSDVKVNSDGSLLLLTYAQVLDATPAERKRDAQVKNAMSQFVDEAILRPNPSQRPLWASDPHFMLVFHLQSFMHSFHKVYLHRIMNEIKYQNYAPVANLLAFVPAFMAVTLMKEVIKGAVGDEDDRDYKKNWTAQDHILEAAYRSGIAGKFNYIPDMIISEQFGGSWMGAFMSPAGDKGTWTDLPVPLR
jgi:hypothetical protein